MKRAKHPFGTPPPEREPDARRPGESHARLASRPSPERHPAPQRLPPAREPAPRRQKYVADGEEPRTGVVRRVDVPDPRVRPAPAPGGARAGARPAGVRARDDASVAVHGARAWRCLEWGQPQKERRPPRAPAVSVAQLSASGELLRHEGPDASLPETGEFMHKMAALIAQGFGYVRCHSVCLKAHGMALAVSEVGESRVMAVRGPLRSMNKVLTRAGLQ